MNQTPNANQFYQPYVERDASYYRAKARASLKSNFGVAILAGFLAALLGGVASSSVSFNVSLPTDFSGLEGGEAGVPNMEDLLAAAAPFLWLGIGIAIFVVLFSIAFNLFVSSPVILGYRKFNLDLIDGKVQDTNSFMTVFSFFKNGYYFKSVIFNLIYTAIKLLASIPMIAATIFFFANVFGMLLSGDPEDPAMILGVVGSALLFLLASVVSCVINILISYNYAFAATILAEYPTTSALDALRKSRTLMHGNRWKLFCLEISFIGWILLASCCTCGLGMYIVTPYMEAAKTHFYHEIAKRETAQTFEFPSINPDDYVVH